MRHCLQHCRRVPSYPYIAPAAIAGDSVDAVEDRRGVGGHIISSARAARQNNAIAAHQRHHRAGVDSGARHGGAAWAAYRA